jgi:hypothetical protein
LKPVYLLKIYSSNYVSQLFVDLMRTVKRRLK